MKKMHSPFMLLLTIALVIFTGLTAQEKIEVKDVNQPTSRGTQPGYSVFIKDATLENVTKKWGQLMKNEKAGDIFKNKEEKVKYEMKAGEYLAERTIVKDISNKYINTIAIISNTAGGVQLTAFSSSIRYLFPNKLWVKPIPIHAILSGILVWLAIRML